jgi:signal transduction histidine kinase
MPSSRPDDPSIPTPEPPAPVAHPGRYLRHAALVVALVAVGLAILSWAGYVGMSDAVRRDAELSARGAAADVDRYVQSRWTALQAIAMAGDLRAGDTAAMAPFFDGIDARALGFGAGIGFIDAAGVARAGGTAASAGPVDLSDRAYVRRAIATGGPVVSEVVEGRVTDVPVVTFLVPVRDEQEHLVGFVGGGLRLDSATLGGDSLRFAGGTAVVVVDAAGNLVTGNEPVTALNQVDASLPLDAMRAQPLGSLIGVTGPQGEPDQLLGYGTAPSAGWLVLVERPVAEALAPARGQLGVRLAAIAIVALIAVLLLAWAERRVERATRAERATLERLRAAVGELERRERLRDAFTSVMSHELRTPVTSIYAASKLLARDPRRPELESLLEDIEEEADRLHRITEDLLVLSRAEHGRVDLRPEPVLVQRVALTVAAAIRRRHPQAQIAMDLPADLPPVNGDPGAVRQILDNLLTNAIKYGRGSEVAVRASFDPYTASLSVEDGGPGLPDGERSRIFELFYRAGSNQREASGTGIGLFVVAQLARSMGGTAVAEAREPSGLRIVVTLPTARPTDAGLEAELETIARPTAAAVAVSPQA